MGAKNSSQQLRPRRGARRAGKAGGNWGNEFRERLRQVILKSSDGNLAAFARCCDLHATRLSGWLAGKQLPSLKHLVAIADKTGISVDWLLDGRNNLGEPSTTPVSRGESLDAASLEKQMARAVFYLLPHEQRRILHPGWIRVDNILLIAAKEISKHLSAQEEIKRRAELCGRDGLVFSSMLWDILHTDFKDDPEFRSSLNDMAAIPYQKAKREDFPLPVSPYIYDPSLKPMHKETESVNE